MTVSGDDRHLGLGGVRGKRNEAEDRNRCRAQRRASPAPIPHEPSGEALLGGRRNRLGRAPDHGAFPLLATAAA